MRHYTASFIATCLLVGGLLSASSSVHAADEVRTLTLYETHLRETTTVTYKRNGKFIAAGLKKLNYVLRDWRTGEPTRINPKLIDTIWELHKELGATGPVQIVSGYRSPKTNRKLRRRGGGQAKRSQHMLGNAMDVRFPGVSTKKLRAAAMRKERGGVGYYASSRFVHVDVARVRAWPRMSRYQLAMVFPDKATRHRPSSGGPLTRRDRYKARIRLAKLGIKRGGSTGRTFLANNKNKSFSSKGQKSFSVATGQSKNHGLWVNMANNKRYAALDNRIVKPQAKAATKLASVQAQNPSALKSKIQNILKEFSQTFTKNKSKGSESTQQVAALTENEADMKDFVARKVGYAPIYSEEDPEEVIYQAFSLSPILAYQNVQMKEPAYDEVDFVKSKIILTSKFRNANTLNVENNNSAFKGRAVRDVFRQQAGLMGNDNAPSDTLKIASRMSFTD